MEEGRQDRKIGEISIREIEGQQMTVVDFDEDDLEGVLDNLRNQCLAVEDTRETAKMDWDMLEKSIRLFDNAECSYFYGNGGDLLRLDFYQVDPSPFLCSEVPGYDADAPWDDEGAINYDRTYSTIRILIEDLDRVFAVYLKDYTLGHIRPLGRCIYGYEPADVPDECGYEEYSRIQIRRRILPYLEELCMSGQINLPEEIYDYYHVIPDSKIINIEERLNDLMTVQEAAKMLGVSASRVKKMVADKVLDGFKRDGRVWLSKVAVQRRVDYIAENGKPKRGKARK